MTGERASILAALVLLVASLAAPTVRAADTQVAVAANFTEPAREIAAAFKVATGHTAVLSFSSSGAAYNQIAHGAPYEVFLSADTKRPRMAEQNGLGVPGSRFTYAVGRIALYSRTPGLVDAGGKVLASNRYRKLAVADPATAPYGAAAIQALRKLGFYDRVRPRFVTGSSITQTYQFVHTGAAELGLVSWSQVADDTVGSKWLIPADLHAPIDQQAILLVSGQASPAARAFVSFLRSPAARAIIRRHGYEVPR